MAKTKSFLSGFLTGGIIAGIAVLSTTKYSGKELREKIASSIDTCKTNQECFKSTFLNVKDQLLETTQICSNSIKDFTTDMKDSITQWKNSTGDNLDTINEEINSIKEEMDELEEKLRNQEK
ncbi:YtxH domain-containing protein [Massilibacterium senegalense]|uniref:YtxH domain-containing protein n=1 Tax=Massilibacterium senegalense TaxID=1632858 RepID=UPI000780AB10|nr:YtxH domain-containing protein [Massilibacterium senegalense]